MSGAAAAANSAMPTMDGLSDDSDYEMDLAAQEAATAHLRAHDGAWRMVMRAAKVVTTKAGFGDRSEAARQRKGLRSHPGSMANSMSSKATSVTGDSDGDDEESGDDEDCSDEEEDPSSRRRRAAAEPSGQSAEQRYAAAVGLIRASRLREAAAQLEQLVALLHAPACHTLADMHMDGIGRQRDVGRAYRLYDEAAQQQHEEALVMAAYCRMQGLGTQQDWGAAVQLLTDAAALHGNPVAQTMLGMCYEYGNGVGVDLMRALYYYSEAAAAGEPEGMVRLAKFHERGKGTREPDMEVALKWYTLAAEAGHTLAARYAGELNRHRLRMDGGGGLWTRIKLDMMAGGGLAAAGGGAAAPAIAAGGARTEGGEIGGGAQQPPVKKKERQGRRGLLRNALSAATGTIRAAALPFIGSVTVAKRSVNPNAPDEAGMVPSVATRRRQQQQQAADNVRSQGSRGRDTEVTGSSNV